MNRMTKELSWAWICVVIATVAFAIGTISFITKAPTSRVAADEKATCRIQARGLPATHLLAGAMADIGVILTPQPHEPVVVLPPAVLKALIDLRMRSVQYATIQNTQPQTRKC